MGAIEQNKFKSESSAVAMIRRLDFPLSAEVVGKEAVLAFKEIESIYKSLDSTVSRYSRPDIKLSLLEPESSTKRVKKFEVTSETSLKERRKVSLDMTVVAEIEGKTGFWMRGLVISELIDLLEDFCNSQNREKGRLVILDRALIPSEEEKD